MTGMNKRGAKAEIVDKLQMGQRIGYRLKFV
jgi:hypothetical protein